MIRPTRLQVLILLGGLALALAFAIPQAGLEHVGTDFHVFWQAGRNFASGQPLYHDYLPGQDYLPGERVFKYPPFAAMAFLLLAPFPLQFAAVLWGVANFALWAFAILLVREILSRAMPERNFGPLPLFLAFLFSAQYFLDNFRHLQMNAVVLVLVLLGIRDYLRGHDVRAAAWFVAGTAMKVTPALFVVWLFLRGRRRAALATVPLGLAFLLVPLLARGPRAGIADLADYDRTFLSGQATGSQICTYHSCQNIGAMVYRLLRPSDQPEGIDVRLIPASEVVARTAYRGLWSAVLLIFLGTLVLRRARADPVSPFEWSLTFLAALLLSPITFKAHLVSLLFVFATFLAVRVERLSRTGRWVAGLGLLAMAVPGLTGQDLVGRRTVMYLSGWSVYGWANLLLFVTAAALLLRRSAPSVPE